MKELWARFDAMVSEVQGVQQELESAIGRVRSDVEALPTELSTRCASLEEAELQSIVAEFSRSSGAPAGGKRDAAAPASRRLSQGHHPDAVCAQHCGPLWRQSCAARCG